MALADLVLYLHALFVLGVVLPVPLIIVGKYRGWRFVRSAPLRLLHLGMIGVVVAESLLGIDCPLTLYESRLRLAGGGGAYTESFIAHWLGRLLFWSFPEWVFTLIYVAFGALVAFLWWWVPPVREGRETAI